MTTPKQEKSLKALKPPEPNEPAGFSEAEAFAIQAMIAGEASPHQQRIGMAWIVNEASRAHGEHFHENDRKEAFALGRAFVGQQIIGLAKINLIAITQPPTKEK